MDQETLNALDGFGAVWQRVLSAQDGDAHISTQEAPAEDALSQAMALWETYTSYAGRTKGETKQRFILLADGIRDTVRALQTEHFLRTGDLYRPETAVPMPEPGMLTGMRRAYQAEQRLARMLADNAPLADISTRHAGVLHDMIAELIRK